MEGTFLKLPSDNAASCNNAVSLFKAPDGVLRLMLCMWALLAGLTPRLRWRYSHGAEFETKLGLGTSC
jgi:hypothetical protein